MDEDIFKARERLLALKAAKIQRLKEELVIRDKLPHLYLQKWYPWQLEFFKNRNRIQCCTAANQCGKSSTMIKKCVEWATNKKLWPDLWPEKVIKQKITPSQFWYLYPTREMAVNEFYDKWMPLMPKVDRKDPDYGWQEIKPPTRSGSLVGVKFNSGVYVYFKTYTQGLEHLQGSSSWATFCFVDGTKILTPNGEQDIEQVKIGDFVATRSGPHQVARISSREASVITVVFSNGRCLEGTPEHKIMTKNRGWVELQNLTPNDVCIDRSSLCQENLSPALSNDGCGTLNSSCLNQQCIDDTQIAKTIEKETTLLRPQQKSTAKAALVGYIKRFGLSLIQVIQAFLMGIACTIKILIHSIIIQRICSFSLFQNIHRSIKKLSGQKNKLSHMLAKSVEKILSQGLVKRILQKFAALNVSRRNIKSLDRKSQLAASCVKKSFLDESATTQDSALRPVRIVASGRIAKVNCLTVEGQPEYFANGVLVHNCDEEVDINLLPELQSRVSATNGYMIFGFTATMGQEFWRQVMEVKSKWPDAYKVQVSLYDCQKYVGGESSGWTSSRIKQVIQNCTTDAEVQRRVYGKFVKDEGLLYSTFSKESNLEPWEPLGSGWQVYVGIDYGSCKAYQGRAHLSAIVFLAVSPKLDRVKAIMYWRGKIGEEMTAQDLIDRYLDMKNYCKHPITEIYYDFSAADVGTIANRAGLPFQKADKSRDRGVLIMNGAFKDRVLTILVPGDGSDKEGIPRQYIQGDELINELSNLGMNDSKSRPSVNDDIVDALRYGLIKIPINWDEVRLNRAILQGRLSVVTEIQRKNALPGSGAERLAYWNGDGLPKPEDVDKELEFWGELADGDGY